MSWEAEATTTTASRSKTKQRRYEEEGPSTAAALLRCYRSAPAGGVKRKGRMGVFLPSSLISRNLEASKTNN